MTTDQLVTALTNRYGIRLSPKDPVFAVVYLNEIMLEQHAEALSARLEANLSNFLMQFRSQSDAAVREMKAAAADSEGILAYRIAASAGDALEVATRETRHELRVGIEGGRTQVMTIIQSHLAAAQRAADDAAQARLWAFCFAGISGVVAAGLIAFAIIKVF
jgi:hypothetical protein